MIFIFYHIYNFKSLTNNLVRPTNYLIPSEYILGNIIIVILIIYFISSNKTPKRKLFLAAFLIYSAFLHKPHNVILLSTITFVLNTTFVFDKAQQKEYFYSKYFGVIWIGFTFYFMQVCCVLKYFINIF